MGGSLLKKEIPEHVYKVPHNMSLYESIWDNTHEKGIPLFLSFFLLRNCFGRNGVAGADRLHMVAYVGRKVLMCLFFRVQMREDPGFTTAYNHAVPTLIQGDISKVGEDA